MLFRYRPLSLQYAKIGMNVNAYSVVASSSYKYIHESYVWISYANDLTRR